MRPGRRLLAVALGLLLLGTPGCCLVFCCDERGYPVEQLKAFDRHCPEVQLTDLELDPDRTREEMLVLAGDQLAVRDGAGPFGVRVTVPAMGPATVPTVGRMTLAGRTVGDIQREVARRTGQVVAAVRIALPASRAVTLAGPFRKPGTYPLNPFRRHRLATLVLEYGGGFQANADRHRLRLTSGAGAARRTRELDWCAHVGNPQRAPIELRPGDVLEVALAAPISVVGSVGKPLIEVPFPPKVLRIYDAIMMAGGPGKFADTGAVDVYRVAPDGQRRRLPPVDVDGIERNAVGATHNIPLAPGDRVVVRETPY